MAQKRTATVQRRTRETDIELTLTIDGTGESKIETGIPFFDHMLTLFARHGSFDLQVRAKGDIEVDYHHTVEDVGIVLGQAFAEALGDKAGIRRYGFFLLPMDETLARIVVDLSGRAVLVYKAECAHPFVRDFNLILVKEFFRSFTNAIGANVHATIEYGEEPHHIAEALFKGLGRALDVCCQIDSRHAGKVPSTKGSLKG
ncbi:MAG TPA: imidazoleglycerol-phosphate dehydratase HisB [Opitutaceae bacterium]|nr:imidazoleglycerol-phosphate dehydratase HisB [Opitutaceae bacterium]